jgi:hypothetical protein
MSPFASAPVQAGAAAGRLLRAGLRLTRELPGGASVERMALRVEDVALGRLGRGLDAATRQVRAELARAGDGAVDPLRERMAELLELSVEHGRAGATRALYGVLVRQLAPDEARILAALSDGRPFPLLHVARRLPTGGTGDTVLRNASTVGREAGVAVAENVPAYVARLLALGLVEPAGHDESLSDEYDILLTDQLVVDAEDAARGARRLAPRILRDSLRISDFGTAFWQACDPSRPAGSP